ncbi:MAG: amidohydrolase family protein [Phycisphaerae bacterium]|jgi:imidazolonepropionase-like amidohydrolase
MPAVRATLAFVVICILLAPAAWAQAESQPASQPATAPASAPTTQSQPTTTTTAAAENEKDRYLAVINGRVHTVTGPVLEQATVLCKNGTILAIGNDVHLPTECTIVDAKGMFVYPGLVAACGGILNGTPESSVNIYSLGLTIALAGGITTSLVGDTAAKLTFGTTEDMVIKDGLFVNLSYSRRNPLQRAELRADLERVRAYLRDQARYERDKERNKDAKPPDKEWLTGEYESYKQLLEGHAVASAWAETTQDLRDLADLASSFGFALVVRGAYEGWTVAGDLGRAGVRAIITPRTDIDPDEDLNRPTGSTIENARILHDHGVPVAVVPGTQGITTWGLAGRDLLHLNMEAAFAVRGGLTNDEALRTITIDAARILGIDDRVGSLEVGKDADLVVCDGDLLHYMTQVHYTIVNGRVAYTKSAESLFAHIRPEGKREMTRFDDQWPRRLEWPE